MGLIYVGSRPSRFQFGDRVEGTVTYSSSEDYVSGQSVVGIITQCVNRDHEQLDRGRVEIKTERGVSMWIQATTVLDTRGQIEHPLDELVPAVGWRCVCGSRGYEASEEAARSSHGDHAH